MRPNKLFHVLVVAGGALGASAMACSSADENPAPTHQTSSSQTGDLDGGEDAAPSPPSGTGSGSHFW